MINFDDYIGENKTKHNKNWPYTPDHPYIILIIGGSGSGKTNVLLNLIDNQPDIDKIICSQKILMKQNINIQLTYVKKYSNYMYDVYKNIDEYNIDKEHKILIVFDDMIADMILNKKLNSIVTELFIRGRKLNISLVFISQSYFKVPKDARLNTTHFLISKIPNKRELQQLQ